MIAPDALHRAAVDGAAPLDALETLADRAKTEFFAALAAAPDVPTDLWRALPGEFGPTLTAMAPAAIVGAAVALAYALTRYVLRRWRRGALAERSAFGGLIELTGLELVALAAAALAGRVLLVRVFAIPPGTESFASDLTVALIRWLAGVTLAIVLFQPAAPRFRLAALDEAGARKAVWRIAALLAVGHLHVVLLEAARRGGLRIASAKLLSCLVAIAIAAGALQLVNTLRRHGLKLAPRLAAIALTLATLTLWLWGWMTLDFDLYRGAVDTITVVLLAVTIDRAIALSIRDSRRPEVMRFLFVLRVVIDALAAALIVRVVFDFWAMGAFGWLSPREWPAFSRRLTFASAMLVLAVALAAVVNAWTEARLTPETGVATEDRRARLARLSTVLPVIRIAAIALIGVVFSLLALSAIGVDVTALLAGAGIIGLAISFGSQTLVKDIVAGLFYMLDDVFRLGETIEAQGRRCQLERINLRSVRLRDEDGRLHTIPFGELGVVTNHSRRLVQMTAVVGLESMPAKGELARFSRDAAAALRSEPLVNDAIVGDVALRLDEATQGRRGALAFTFAIAAVTAERARALVQHLIEETVNVSGVEGLSPAVSVDVADIANAPHALLSTATFETPRTGGAMNMA